MSICFLVHSSIDWKKGWMDSLKKKLNLLSELMDGCKEKGKTKII